jgi:putative ABC transport system ATP-binding protein
MMNDTPTRPPQIMPAPIVQLDRVSKLYGSGNTEVRALDDISLTIRQGEYCAIVGPSGSGKSTAMNVIGCLDRPTIGRYALDGIDVSQISETDLAKIRNQKLGFVFQQFHLLAPLSALENVMLPTIYGNVPPRERLERATAALDRVGLSHRLHNKPNQLSGGQQQRVAIARAIVNRPTLILADEPTGALDTHTTEEVMSIFAELNAAGITIITVTHEIEVARLSRRIIMFRDGQIIDDNIQPDRLEQFNFYEAESTARSPV